MATPDFKNLPDAISATITSGQAVSAAFALDGMGAIRINMPAGWDAAGLTFQVSMDGVTYINLYDKFGEYSISSSVVGASRSIILPPADFAGVRYMKVRSGTSGTPVNQTADRVISLVVRPL